MVLVVILKPLGQLPEHGLRIRKVGELNIIPLEGVDKRFRHAVALRTYDRGGAHDQAHNLGKLPGLFGGVAGAVVGKPLDRMEKRFRSSEPGLQRLYHQVPDQASVLHEFSLPEQNAGSDPIQATLGGNTHPGGLGFLDDPGSSAEDQRRRRSGTFEISILSGSLVPELVTGTPPGTFFKY